MCKDVWKKSKYTKVYELLMQNDILATAACDKSEVGKSKYADYTDFCNIKCMWEAKDEVRTVRPGNRQFSSSNVKSFKTYRFL